MAPRVRLLLAVLLLPLAAPAPAPASPAERTNTALRKQIAAPLVLLRDTKPMGEDVEQSLDVSDTTQALVCTQIFGVLPFRTFRRQRFDSFTSCSCVSELSAVCERDTFYPTVTPGTPEALLAQEHSVPGDSRFIEMLNAFSVQQTCFFQHLRGQTLSPPRPCAFSWAQGSRPACDCAQPVVAGAEGQEAGQQAAPAAEAEPGKTPDVSKTPDASETLDVSENPDVSKTPDVSETPDASETLNVPEASPEEGAKPVTERSTKGAVQAVIKPSAGAAPVGAPAVGAAVERAQTPDLPGRSAGLKQTETERLPVVAEAFHLRRVRSARRN